jgi:CheY-like chemotaxis protein
VLKGDGLTADQAEWAERIHDAGKHLLTVVNEMIRLSELEGWTGEAAEPAPADAEPLKEVSRQTPAEGGRPLRVLYVDDNEANRALVTAILTAHGIGCQTANDGREGLLAATAGGWDLILMDIQMPVMDGVEATRAIRALPGPAGAVPIVALTANTLEHQLRDYAVAGMQDTIAKPVDMAELIAKVLAWCETVTEPSMDLAAQA